MDDVKVIIKPIITEQSMHFANTRGAYSFQVNKNANKIQIRNAIERIFDVKVTDVRTSNRRGKPRRRGRSIGYTSSWKKATVVLAGDQHIDLF